MKDNDLNAICNPILGKNLLEIYPEYSKIIFPDFVSQTPGVAIERINNYFEVQPSINGNNIPGIIDIRDRLFKIAEQNEFVNAFAIVASHTHWNNLRPIVYTFDINENQYIIGPHNVNINSIYYPVSFAFYNGFPLAFEWCEAGLINELEYKKAFLIICKLNSEIKSKKYPIGVSIDFRFKKYLFEKPIPSVELPIDKKGHKFFGYSKIITLEYFETNQKGEETEQVAWHPFSDLNLGLNENELEVLNNLRIYFTSTKTPLNLEHINEMEKLIKKNV